MRKTKAQREYEGHEPSVYTEDDLAYDYYLEKKRAKEKEKEERYCDYFNPHDPLYDLVDDLDAL